MLGASLHIRGLPQASAHRPGSVPPDQPSQMHEYCGTGPACGLRAPESSFQTKEASAGTIGLPNQVQLCKQGDRRVQPRHQGVSGPLLSQREKPEGAGAVSSQANFHRERDTIRKQWASRWGLPGSGSLLPCPQPRRLGREGHTGPHWDPQRNHQLLLESFPDICARPPLPHPSPAARAS